jgi:arylsulfatase A-like enzyme
MWDVHYDYAAPKDHDVFDPEYTGWLNGSNFWELEKKDPRDPRDVAHLKALYDAEIRYTDEHIGRILDLLRAHGRLDDTLVVFVSDHGEEFFEHGLFGHYHTLYEEVLRVPLVMRYPPALRSASRTNELVSLADVAPTILELCGLQPPSGMWGRSVLAAATGKLAPRDAPLELAFHRPENFLRGVHGGDHKVIQASKEPHARVFDLATDPGEQHPLLEGEGVPASDARIAGARGLWKSLDERARTLQREGESQPPPDLEDDLRRTGYIGTDKHK